MNMIILLCAAAAIVIIFLVHTSVENYNAKIKIALFLKRVQSVYDTLKSEMQQDPTSNQTREKIMRFIINLHRFPDRKLSYFFNGVDKGISWRHSCLFGRERSNLE